MSPRKEDLPTEEQVGIQTTDFGYLALLQNSCVGWLSFTTTGPHRGTVWFRSEGACDANEVSFHFTVAL